MIYQVGEYKDRDAHLRHSLRTVNDMELLVREILSASRMAGNDFSLTLSEVDLSQLVRECCRKWQGAAEDREQNFQAEIEAGCTCRGDMALLQKAVSNIISNAVTHSPAQTEISVKLTENTLQVRNSGISMTAPTWRRYLSRFTVSITPTVGTRAAAAWAFTLSRRFWSGMDFPFAWSSTSARGMFTITF